MLLIAEEPIERYVVKGYVVFEAARRLVYVVGAKSARLADVALEAVLDGEQLREARLLSNLAVVHDSTGDYEEAKVLHERALAIREKALGPEHPDLAQSLNNLASVLYTTGNYEEVEAWLAAHLE